LIVEGPLRRGLQRSFVAYTVFYFDGTNILCLSTANAV
jgi:hypothetical protein